MNKNKKGGATFLDRLTKAITESFNNNDVSYGPTKESEVKTMKDNKIKIDMSGQEAATTLQKLIAESFYSDAIPIAKNEEEVKKQTDASSAATEAINKESLKEAQDALQTLTKIAGNALNESQDGGNKNIKKRKKSTKNSSNKNKSKKNKKKCNCNCKSRSKSKTNKL